jgi:hypothetical protein
MPFLEAADYKGVGIFRKGRSWKDDPKGLLISDEDFRRLEMNMGEA